MILWTVSLMTMVLWLALPLAASDTCAECHAALEGELQAPAVVFVNDVHRRVGFGCADCHGGDATAKDPEVSMSRARAFLGKIARSSVPRLCARCHSDASLMHRFKPQQRVDQLAQYQTSVHGRRLAAGDEAVANCVDCHSVHDIREVKDALATVHPLRLTETCARCHADPEHMKKYKIPTTQFADYRESVHWEALSRRRDLSAPSCASCHGNHGAAPPEVASVAAICGTCHALLEDLYNRSPHQPVFSSLGMAGCVTCHGNHAVYKPSARMLAGSDSVCSQCHDQQSGGGKAASEMGALISRLQKEIDRAAEIVERARRSGMEVSESLLRLQEGRQSIVKARVAVHNSRVDAVAEPVNEGLLIAAETYQAGEKALKERDIRRVGLSISLLAIFATVVGLWMAIRSIEGQSAGGSS